MKNSETVTPVAAALTALSTLVCCLPGTVVAAAATGGVSLFVSSHQQWFFAASLLLLGVGILQLRRAQRTCRVSRSGSTIVLWISAAIVLLVVLFPQVLAGLIADWLT